MNPQLTTEIKETLISIIPGNLFIEKSLELLSLDDTNKVSLIMLLDCLQEILDSGKVEDMLNVQNKSINNKNISIFVTLVFLI